LPITNVTVMDTEFGCAATLSVAAQPIFPQTRRQVIMKKSCVSIARSVAFSLAVAGLLSGAMTACTSTRTSESTGEYVDDVVISSKVRGEILADKNLKIYQIDVETFKGVVQLSGFVDSSASKARAGQVAAGVTGVTNVRNNLIVK